MQSIWQLQEAKSKFSALVDKALLRGPQIITRRGKETAVVLSMKDYNALVKTKSNFVDFLLNSPLKGMEIDFKRDKSSPREIDL
ncbi:MAG: type II toxin-antitoxin system Phd/YefM family antitoxin [bacterium]